MRHVACLLAVCGLACAAARPGAHTGELRQAPVNGSASWYVAEGSGPPLVIVHGAYGDLRSFERVAAPLRGRRTVVRVSLRHHWPAPPRPVDETLATYGVAVHAADVAALIESLGRGPADLVGHSYGGTIALALARSRPELVRSLTLAEPALLGFPSDLPSGDEAYADVVEWCSRVLERMKVAADPREVGRAVFDLSAPGTFEGLHPTRRGIFLENAHTVRPLLTRCELAVRLRCDDVADVRAPVLLVDGERTGEEMRAIDLELLRCLPRARRVVVPGSGHALQFDAPDALASAIAGFVRDGVTP